MSSLVWFHRLLIVAAIAFCAGFAVWEVLAYRRGGGVGDLLLALVFAVLAAGLTFYLSRLKRFLKLPD